MDIVLMGAPGAGKGTQAYKLEKTLNYKHISTGDVLRAEIASGSEQGKEIAEIINEGNLISDEMMLSILKKTVENTPKPIIFDGFPRTVKQAEMLKDMLAELGRTLGKAVVITLPEDTVVQRLSARKQCRLPDGTVKQIGPNFSLQQCQEQEGEIFTRPDDTPEHVLHRLAVYHEQTEPIILFYQRANLYAEVNGDQEPEKVFEELLAVVKA
ncbi:MAG: nucleoside monophosphate kinase [Elusimicrobiaceae bacterium]|nr:nucleoside monophosphate kinase [Elusimicrobiaceae bacterium]